MEIFREAIFGARRGLAVKCRTGNCRANDAKGAPKVGRRPSRLSRFSCCEVARVENPFSKIRSTSLVILNGDAVGVRDLTSAETSNGADETASGVRNTTVPKDSIAAASGS